MSERGVARWQALGTTVLLKTTSRDALAAAQEAVRRELDAIDTACSRFRADSEISRANRQAGRTAAISPLLAEAVELALRAAAITGGDVDPTIGRALARAGYDRDWSLMGEPSAATAQTPASAAPVAVSLRDGWRAVDLDRDAGLLRIPAGVELDLGATAKAWAADRAAQAACSAAGCGALVGIGGDIALAGPAPHGGWLVRVTDDHRDRGDAPGQTIRLSCGGLATSSTTVRRWLAQGREMHHIIDPASSQPARSRWRTVSVAAASCADANIASTASVVKSTAAVGWLRSHRLPARLVARDGSETHLCGWPAAEEQAA